MWKITDVAEVKKLSEPEFITMRTVLSNVLGGKQQLFA